MASNFDFLKVDLDTAELFQLLIWRKTTTLKRTMRVC